MTVSEIDERLETELGVRLSRLELRVLVADLERCSTVAAPHKTGNSLGKDRSASIDTVALKSAPNADYLEMRLRESSVERQLALYIRPTIRWFLFVPGGLAAGVLAFVVVLFGFMIVPVADVVSFGGLGAGLIGGLSTVYVGMIIAPRNARIIALVMGAASVVLTAVFLLYAWHMPEFENSLASLICAGTY